MEEELKYLKEELKTQDNRFTADPIFIVYEKISYTSQEGYSDDFMWVDDDGDEIGSKEDFLEHLKETFDFGENRIAELNNDLDFEDKFEYDGNEYKKWHYQIIPRFNQAFFTEKAAKEYISYNGHNLTEPYIYAKSLWRNTEMQNIRKYFIENG